MFKTTTVGVDDRDWDFGQILPVVLLVGPIAAAVEAIMPESGSEEGGDASNPMVQSDSTPRPPPVQPQPVQLPTTPREFTQEQLYAQLHACYTDKHVMAATMVLSSLQILVVTSSLLSYQLSTFNETITDLLSIFSINVFVIHPVNSIIVLLLGLEDHAYRMALGMESGRPNDRGRRRWFGAFFRWFLTLGLLAFDAVLFTFGCSLNQFYIGGALCFLFGVGIWDAVRLRVTMKQRGPEPTDALPMVDRGWQTSIGPDDQSESFIGASGHR